MRHCPPVVAAAGTDPAVVVAAAETDLAVAVVAAGTDSAVAAMAAEIDPTVVVAAAEMDLAKALEVPEVAATGIALPELPAACLVSALSLHWLTAGAARQSAIFANAVAAWEVELKLM